MEVAASKTAIAANFERYKMSVKEHVKAGDCKFICADRNNLWYRTALAFEFPVPISDMGDATFNFSEKGMLMMRYIRKHMELIEKEKSLNS